MKNRPYVFITGATKGIGRALAQRFALEGAHLALSARSSKDLEALKAGLLKDGAAGEVRLFPADLSQKAEAVALAAAVSAAFPHLDVLVNNAGLFRPGQVLGEAEEAMEQMLAVNLLAPYYLSRGLLPRMRRGSHLFNVASVAGREGYVGKGSYGVSKAALLSLTNTLRHELREAGVRVTAVLPGPTWSASWEGADLPAQRLLQASEVAASIWQAWAMPPNAVIEEIVIRPQLGDL